MRDNSQDETLKRNYLQKYRFLIAEYELVKAGKHPEFDLVQDFYTHHDTDRRSFRKYYNRYLQSGDENLKGVKDYPNGQDVVRPFSDPVKKDGHLVILYGNLASEGAVAKISGKEGLSFTGTAKCFASEESALKAILDGTIQKGHVIVIRYEGPMGMGKLRHLYRPHARLQLRDLLTIFRKRF